MKRTLLLCVAGSLSLLGRAVAGAPEAERHLRLARELYKAEKYLPATAETDKARAALTPDPACRPLQMPIDYYDALCAAHNGDGAAEAKLENFLLRYSDASTLNEIRFALGNIYYLNGHYGDACVRLLSVNPLELGQKRQSQYYYKLGYCHFMLDDYNKAYPALRQSLDDPSCEADARYCLAYIDYLRGDYASAREGFVRISGNEIYKREAPYFLLQIDYLTGDYKNVTANGDKVITSLKGERAIEAARVAAEGAFREGAYPQMLNYMERFLALGGVPERDELYLLGFGHHNAGDYARAAGELAGVCTVDDRMTRNASYHLGDCYLQLGDRQSALKSFSIAASGSMEEQFREDALYNYGKLQYEQGGGLFNEAINALGRYIQEYPASPLMQQVKGYLASAYFNTRNYAAAYEAMSQIADPDNDMKAAMQKITYFRAMELYRDGDYDAAYLLLEESATYRSNQKYTALATFWVGDVLFKRGEYNKAAVLFKNYLAVSPAAEREHIMAPYNVGYCYFNLGRRDDAREWFDRFLYGYYARDAYRADACNRLGDLAYQRRDFAQAISHYESAISIGPPARDYARLRRAMMYGYVGDGLRKIAALREIIAEGKGTYVDRAHYELARAQIASENFAEAGRTLREFVDGYPNSPYHIDALNDLGLVSLNVGDREAAMKYYKQVAAAAPASPQGKEALASIRSIYVDAGDAASYFGYAREIGAESDLSTVRRDSLSYAAAETLYLRGDYARAAAAMQSYLGTYRQGTYTADALYYLGDCKQRGGDAHGAAAAFERLSKLHFNSFTLRGLRRLAAIHADNDEHEAAARAYRKWSEYAENPADGAEALAGYLTSTAAVDNPSRMVQAANETLASPFVDAKLRIRAQYLKAKACEAQGDDQLAQRIYAELAADPTTAEGAEAAYRVIEYAYLKPNHAEAKRLVIAFGESRTPHGYWLAQAFIILGDVYAAEGDAFQARATWQSIVDGYTVADDGVMDLVRERLKKLR
ncbi:MAG: tetratricopeptide repeat protein [Rikenellaceae bacterium]|jgi:TolA-binding protein|nr:tetratricopeptide repeat protein [Rikenellaceae bacterium]